VPAAPPDDGGLVALLRDHYRAFGQREWAEVSAHFWKGATIVTIRQPRGGGAETVISTAIEDYVDEMKKLGNTDKIDFDLADPGVEIDGVVAVARVAYKARTHAPNEPHPWRGADVFLLVRHDGNWRIASVAFGSPTFDQ
jgi:hypothetical protein